MIELATLSSYSRCVLFGCLDSNDRRSYNESPSNPGTFHRMSRILVFLSNPENEKRIRNINRDNRLRRASPFSALLVGTKAHFLVPEINVAVFVLAQMPLPLFEVWVLDASVDLLSVRACAEMHNRIVERADQMRDISDLFRLNQIRTGIDAGLFSSGLGGS